MPKFRKKRVVIEAMQWDGSQEKADEIARWAGDGVSVRVLDDSSHGGKPRLFLDIVSWDGGFSVNPGVWIIKEGRGLNSCDPTCFDATYEVVMDGT